MRQFCLVLTALLGVAGPATAQVTIDLQALDAVPGAKRATKEPAARRAAPKQPPRTAAKPKPVPAPASSQAGKLPAPVPAPPVAAATTPPAMVPPGPQAAPPPATLPTAPPPTVALTPIAPAPPPPAVAPPPPPPISETSASAATATGAGLRVTFGAGRTDLSPASAAAIRDIVRSAPPGDTTSFNVAAYAAGTPEDPSTARRLSLARALAVRSALMADGVSSARIYVRALGATGGEDVPDRVDLSIMGANAPAAELGAKSPSQ